MYISWSTLQALKVSIEAGCESMEPLRNLVTHMANALPLQQAREDFNVISQLLGCMSLQPTIARECATTIKSQSGPDRSVLASFKNLAQGKKLLALAEEHVVSCSDSVELHQKLEEVKSKAETFLATVGSIQLAEGVTQCLDLLSSIRSFASKVESSKNDGSQASLKAATDAVRNLVSGLALHHVKVEANPWLSSQAQTLNLSQILSKPPAFEVLKLSSESKRALGGEIKVLVDLEAFYTGTAEVASEVDALLRMPSSTSFEARKACIVRLCKTFQSWCSKKSTVLVSFPDMFETCAKLSLELDGYVDLQSTTAWRQSLAGPLQRFSKIVCKNMGQQAFQELRKEGELQSALGSMDDALLLLTGIQDQGSKKNAEMATSFVQKCLRCADNMCNSECSNAAAASSMLQVLHVIEVVNQKLTPGAKVTPCIDSSAMKSLI